jgi:hypothetical protein
MRVGRGEELLAKRAKAERSPRVIEARKVMMLLLMGVD